MDTQPSATEAYPETADIETSSDDYATRFRGASGAWMLAVQTRLTRRLLAGVPRGSLLDVGGGHGQLAFPLADDGWQVTVLGSAAECRHRVAALADAGRCVFTVGNVVDLPYPDGHFDAVVCFRLLTHCDRWPQLVRELCRVSRGPVIVDYPTSQSLNALAPALFAAKKSIERNTRTWRLFRHREVDEAFAAAGFQVRARLKQFALPMVLHRALRTAPISRLLEALCRGAGLTAWLGSPVVLRADRR
ncbi:MAG: methyltransferase domain-containing protein [Lentisphaerae bacterium]|nr:methyltransferase domain-containing protein [Lentisphaerota bacterium]